MNTDHIQAQIDTLRETLNQETLTYRNAIRAGASFEVAKDLLNKRKKTMEKITELAIEYNFVLDEEIEILKKNKKNK